MPDRAPLPRADIRQRMIPLGPVAVFGASNFPLAFSTAGGDTASALAAGCPVVVKGHPAHPRTGILVARGDRARRREAAACTPGTFSFLLGRRHRARPGSSSGTRGSRPSASPAPAAAGSPSSPRQPKRPEPIPVYAEMSSINPVVVLPGALAEGDARRSHRRTSARSPSAAGQFCTNPGLLFLPTGEDGDAFLDGHRRGGRRDHRPARCSPRHRRRLRSGTDRLKAHRRRHRRRPAAPTAASTRPPRSSPRPPSSS